MIKLIRRISLRLRLLIGFVIMFGLLGTMGWIGVRGSQEQEHQTRHLDQLLVLTKEIGQIQLLVSEVNGWQVSYAWEASWMGGRAATNEASPSRRAFADTLTALKRDLRNLERSGLSPEERTLAVAVQVLVDQYQEIDNQIVAHFRLNTPEGLRKGNGLVLGTGYSITRSIQNNVAKLVTSIRKRSAQAHEQALSTTNTVQRIELTGSALSLILALGIALLITRSVVLPVSQAVAGLRALADPQALSSQEIGAPLPENGHDELTDMARAFNRTAALLRQARADQESLTERLRTLAFTDPLTGLVNRNQFFERLHQVIDRARNTDECVVVMLMDLNDFKPVNDQFGHIAGDQVLQEVAARVRGLLRASDTVARLGGDEFAILVEGERSAHLTKLLTERIANAVREPVQLGEAPEKDRPWVVVTASIGVACAFGDQLSASQLLEAADRAMYQEKRRHKQTLNTDTDPLAYQLWRIDHSRGGWT